MEQFLSVFLSLVAELVAQHKLDRYVWQSHAQKYKPLYIICEAYKLHAFKVRTTEEIGLSSSISANFIVKNKISKKRKKKNSARWTQTGQQLAL